MVIVIIVVVVLILLAIFYYIGKRNGIISARNRVDESWSGIDVQLKRRHDLVPNLVETVKGYATHEREVFQRNGMLMAVNEFCQPPAGAPPYVDRYRSRTYA